MHHNTIEITELGFRYPDGRPALHTISLKIEAGEKVALIGPNGAGKSTLLLQLNGLLRPEIGHLKVCGLDVTEKNLGQIRAAVGMVFQDPNDQLFSPTVFDDVAFGPLYQRLPEVEVRARVSAALADVGMEGYAARTSYHLSLGEKKRIAIATVLTMVPEILVLDEPTAGLDPRARRELIALLQRLRPTQLVATHDLDLVRQLCNRTIVMDQGRIVADDETTIVLDDAALLLKHGLS
jgi:cobalt/nickel transport system ATP-binding protein